MCLFLSQQPVLTDVAPLISEIHLLMFINFNLSLTSSTESHKHKAIRFQMACLRLEPATPVCEIHEAKLLSPGHASSHI